MRVPLAGPYNTRISAVNAADNTSGYVGVGIVGLMVVGKTVQASTKDARYINCFAHTVKDPLGGPPKIYTVKRPGFGTQSTPASGKKGYAVFVWTGSGAGTSVISAFNTPNSTVYNGTTSLGAITGTCTGINETTVGTTATLLVTGSDNTGWYYDTGVGVMTKITNANFPGVSGQTLVGTFATIKGFNCILTASGQLWASDVNSVTGWTANSYGPVNSYPDQGIACIRQGEFLLAFGTESLEFWYDAGLTPFPLARADAKTQRVGAVSADAIAKIADTIWWAGAPPEGGLSVFQYDGSLSRVSTPEVDSILTLAGASNVSLTTLRFYGLSFVLVKAGATTLVYCVEEKMWHEWNSTTPLWYKCTSVTRGGTMVNYAVSNVDTTGKVFLMNHASLVFTDNAAAYTARIQLPNMDLGTKNRKFWKMAELVCDREVSASTITLSFSDDDYQTYTTFGTGDLSQARVNWQRLGSSRVRGWVLTHAAATPMRLEALELEVEKGLN